MKKAGFLFICVFLLSLALWAGQRSATLRVIVQKANIREEPDTSARIIAQVALGSLLEAQTKAGDWYEISLTGTGGEKMIGYIHGNLVEIFEPEQQQQPIIQEKEVYPEQPKVGPQPAAQNYERRPPRKRSGGFKIMGSMIFSKMNISEELPEEVRLKSYASFGGGLGFELALTPNVLFEIDFNYAPGGTQMDAVVEYEGMDFLIEGELAGQALSAPVLLKVKFLPGTSPYIVAGGEAGFVLSQKLVYSIPGYGEEEYEIDEEDIKRLYYGLLFGGGFEIDLDFLSFLVEFRYHMGLSNQIKDPPPDSYARNNALSFVFGIKL